MPITVTVTDMSCEGCEEIVEDAVSEVAGVDSVDADRDTETVTVEGDAEVDAVSEAIDFAGYTPTEGAETAGDEAESTAGEDEPEAEDESDTDDEADDEE